MTLSMGEFAENWKAFKACYEIKRRELSIQGRALGEPSIDRFVQWLETGKIE